MYLIKIKISINYCIQEYKSINDSLILRGKDLSPLAKVSVFCLFNVCVCVLCKKCSL